MITTMKNNTIMFAALIVFSMLIFVNAAQAGGGMIRDANPVRGDDCLYQIPEGIDEQDCEEIVSADNSFPSILKCNAEIIFINCEGDDNPSSDGNSNPNDEEDDS